jgi:hypothetical protein
MVAADLSLRENPISSLIPLIAIRDRPKLVNAFFLILLNTEENEQAEILLNLLNRKLSSARTVALKSVLIPQYCRHHDFMQMSRIGYISLAFW